MLKQANTNKESYVVSREGNEVSGARINRVYLYSRNFFTRSSLRRKCMDYPKRSFTNKYLRGYNSIYKYVCTYFVKNRTAINHIVLC